MVTASAVMLSACYSQGGYTPTVDPYNDPNAYLLNQDMAETR
jgi:outer membrane lipoprotein SlyB